MLPRSTNAAAATTTTTTTTTTTPAVAPPPMTHPPPPGGEDAPVDVDGFSRGGVRFVDGGDGDDDGYARARGMRWGGASIDCDYEGVGDGVRYDEKKRG